MKCNKSFPADEPDVIYPVRDGSYMVKCPVSCGGCGYYLIRGTALDAVKVWNSRAIIVREYNEQY